MTARLVERCDICGRGELRSVLSLGASPPTCVMRPMGTRLAAEEHHPLELLYCADCAHGQLSVAVDPKVVFPEDYPYSSGNSRALHADFANLAAQAVTLVNLGDDGLVVDIGANDGTLLRKFDGCRTVGIEPTGQARRITGNAYQSFFTSAVAARVHGEHGPAKVVTACNVLAHVADITDVMRGITRLLADDGVLIAENHDLQSVVDGQWDTVYHEHLRFYSPHSFELLLRSHGLRMIRWEPIPTHGGSFRMVAGRVVPDKRPEKPQYDFEGLQDCARMTRRGLRRSVLDGAWGIGATARATTIINYCGLDVEDIECVCEVSGSDKIGHYVPGTRIPVVDEAALFEEQPDRAVLFSWHLADSIIPKLRERGFAGDVILPLPSLTLG